MPARPPSPSTGIINGGVVSALFDCHGNWTAAIALMDKAALPKPPLTLTYEMLVSEAGIQQIVVAVQQICCCLFHG